jgi:hypothetical protein
LKTHRRGYRAISEMVSVLILLGIAVVAGIIIYRGYFLQTQQQQVSIEQAVELARKRIGERFSLVDGYIRIINYTTKELVLIIYNHGDVDVTFWKIYVPAVREGGDLVLLTFEVNKTIPKGSIDTIKIVINDPTLGYPPGITVRITVQTFSYRLYSFDIRTIGGG